MSVYNVSGDTLSNVFQKDSVVVQQAFDISGNKIFPVDDPYLPERTLVFEDDFNGNSLNTQNWGYELGPVRKNELQVYTRENVTVENGCLVLTALKNRTGDRPWTSGSITGMEKRSFTYGRIEAKIKFPNVVGAFGAFWTLGANYLVSYDEETGGTVIGDVGWTECGEIDITETIPGNATWAQANLWSYFNDKSLGIGKSGTIVSSDWNIYSCEWTPEYIAMSVNGTEYKRYTFSNWSADTTQAYHLPQYILFDLAVGKAGGTPSSDNTQMKMYVDWVRVYAPLGG